MRGLTGDSIRRSVAAVLVVVMLAVGLVQHEQQSSATVVVTDRMALGGAHTCVIN
ncbi:MAG: hypothetical protein F2545_04995, partial [Actinobacteria bacterium]|nr:hypothetical protein [Actinomycetota bacterium]